VCLKVGNDEMLGRISRYYHGLLSKIIVVMARLIGGRYDGTVKTGKQRFGTHVGVFKDLIMSSFGF
jgi:hypothetical protein